MRLGVWTDHHDPQSTGPSVRLPQADVRPLKLPGAYEAIFSGRWEETRERRRLGAQKLPDEA
jgi:hypothetical protein